MNYLSYQDEKRRIVEEPSQANFATVVGVYEDGLQLQFDGESEATAKRYRYNKSITFKLGDRVKVTRVSGTYVAEYPIGKGKFSVAPDNVSGINATAGETEVSIQWSDPADKTVDGQLVSKWAGTYLVRNEIDFPKNETDGTQVLNSQTRDAYKSTPFVDKGLTSGKTYYYGLFPYSDDGKVNTNRENTFRIELKKFFKYGIRIDTQNSDPDTAVEYIFDAVGKRPARVNLETGDFDYGDWENVGFVKDCKPCMLNFNGIVDYYLNPNDYSKKEDGSPSDIDNSNYLGNAMVEFPLWYLTQYTQGNYIYIIVSENPLQESSHAYAFTKANNQIGDKMYLSMFLSAKTSDKKMKSIRGVSPADYPDTEWSRTQMNIGGYYWFSSFSERDYVAALLIILAKSIDLKEAFGYGPSTAYQVSDNVSAKFFGMKESANRTMNVFHLKNWWGDPYYLAGAGLHAGDGTSEIIKIKPTPPFDSTWLGVQYYPLSANSGISGDGKGYCSKVNTDSKIKVPYQFQGSQTTYFCSYSELGALAGQTFALIAGDSRCAAIGLIKSLWRDQSGIKSLTGKIRLACHP